MVISVFCCVRERMYRGVTKAIQKSLEPRALGSSLKLVVGLIVSLIRLLLEQLWAVHKRVIPFRQNVIKSRIIPLVFPHLPSRDQLWFKHFATTDGVVPKFNIIQYVNELNFGYQREHKMIVSFLFWHYRGGKHQSKRGNPK